MKGLKAARISEAFRKGEWPAGPEEKTSDIVAHPFDDLVLACNALGEPSLLDMASSSEYDRMMLGFIHPPDIVLDLHPRPKKN